ncbi:hypothetical protein BKA70DRAFT_1227865 [Coprinopsis sp. MPI-PUGE-AT-0042]|nr:hypothetical protein BKA70DRAFT_1227865 [Coprinopsis sp. MPI-PUGE-AT-0042]
MAPRRLEDRRIDIELDPNSLKTQIAIWGKAYREQEIGDTYREIIYSALDGDREFKVEPSAQEMLMNRSTSKLRTFDILYDCIQGRVVNPLLQPHPPSLARNLVPPVPVLAMDAGSSSSAIRPRGADSTVGGPSLFQGAQTVNINGGNINVGNQYNAGAETAGDGRDWPRFAEWKEYCRWLVPEDELKTMWGTGMPGAGKTIFASIVINEVELHAQASPRICVAYIYFRYSDHTTATVRDFLATLVKQTTERHPDCLALCVEPYNRHIREKTQPSEAELLQLLHCFSEVLEVMFCFLDALDEAPTNVQLDLLEKLSSLNLTSLKPIDTQFVPRTHDLDLHIAKDISRSAVLRSILNQGGPALREKIETIIKQKCGGMFLHASLQLDALHDCASLYDVEKTLEEFPRRIEDVYQRTWNRILDQSPNMVVLAKNVLIWVLCAMKSLTVGELCYVVATCPDTHKFDPHRLVNKATLMGLCRGLVNVEEKTNIVRFVHYTAKDIVKGLVSESSPYPHSLPAMFCMALLTEHGFQKTTFIEKAALSTTLDAKPLVLYAYKHWSDHAHNPPAIAIPPRMLCFPIGLRYNPFRDPQVYDILGPLHMAVYFDFPLSVAGTAHLRNPNHPTPRSGQTPLIFATRRNSLRAMKELLSLPGILVNAADKHGDNPLLHAIKGYRQEARLSLLLLLDHSEINVNMVDSYGRTALMLVWSEEVALLLLAHSKIKVNQVDLEWKTALMRSSFDGSISVVRVLLADPRVKVNLKSKAGMTALDMAEERYWGDDEPYDQIIELLRTHSDRYVIHFQY